MYTKKIWFDDAFIYVETTDGKTGKTPLNWFPKLQNASPAMQQDFELWGEGSWIHWEQIGEDLSTEGFFSFTKTNILA